MNYDDINAGTVFVSRDAWNRQQGTFVVKLVVNEDNYDLEPQEAFKKND